MRFLARLFSLLLVLTALLALLALASINRHEIRVYLNPLSVDATQASNVLNTFPLDPAQAWYFSAPLFLLLFGSVMVGVALGGASVWWGQRRYRRAMRASKTKSIHARAEVERLRAELAAAKPHVAPALPGLRPRHHDAA